MPEQRPAIPAELERNLMIEAGYRCAVCKETSGLVIDHIVEWARVRKHEFNNMIVLCAVCHARKRNNSDPRHISRASLEQIKSNLMILNYRYSDLERRIIEAFQAHLVANPRDNPSVLIPERMSLLVWYLIRDRFVSHTLYQSAMIQGASDGTTLQDNTLRLTLTPAGREFIQSLTRVA
jgi:HNH endonuclease